MERKSHTYAIIIIYSRVIKRQKISTTKIPKEFTRHFQVHQYILTQSSGQKMFILISTVSLTLNTDSM